MQDLIKLGYSAAIIDCSKYQESFDLPKIVGSGIQAIIHQASQGDATDIRYIERAQSFARYSQETKTPLLWGAYCLLNPHSRFNGAEQAQVFFDTIIQVPIDNILPVLDLEEVTGVTTGIHKTPSLQMVEEFMTRFLKLMQQHYKMIELPLIGGNAQLLNVIFPNVNIRLAGHRISQYPLWLMRYNVQEALEQPIAWQGKPYALWQYSDGKTQNAPEPKAVPGCANSAGHCDRSAYKGSIEDLYNWWSEHSYAHSPKFALERTVMAPSSSVIPAPFFTPAASSQIRPECIKTLPNDDSFYNASSIEALYHQGFRVLLNKATEGESVQKMQHIARAQAVLNFNQANPDKPPMLWAASHHLRASVSSTPENQAKNFVEVISQIAIPTIFVIEVVNRQNQIQTLSEVEAFMSAVNDQLGQQRFIIKGNPNHLNRVFTGSSDQIKNSLASELWVENYAKAKSKPKPTLPKASSQALIWEYEPNKSCFIYDMTKRLQDQLSTIASHAYIPQSKDSFALRG